MVERLGAHAGRLHEYAQVLYYLILAVEATEAARTKRFLELSL